MLVAGDEGVLVANRLPGSGLPVIDQVDADTAAACRMLAVEVRPPGHTLRLLADPVALGARLGLAEAEAADAAAVSRALADHANAVVGLLPAVPVAPGVPDEPWVMTAGEVRLTLRAACPRLAGWPVGAYPRSGQAPELPGEPKSMTCSPWTWPPRPRRPPPGRAAPAGRCWSPR